MEALKLQSYDEWLEEHLEELVERYAGRAVAIYDGEIIAIGDSEAEVYKLIRARELSAEMPLVFRVPTEEDFQSVL